MVISESWSLASGKVTLAIGGSVIALVGLGIVALIFSWYFLRATFCIVIPTLSMLWPLTGLLHALWMHPGEVGHLTGAVVGVFFLLPILRNGVATHRTTWAIGAAENLLVAGEGVVATMRRNWQRRIFPAVLVLLAVVLVLVLLCDR